MKKQRNNQTTHLDNVGTPQFCSLHLPASRSFGVDFCVPTPPILSILPTSHLLCALSHLCGDRPFVQNKPNSQNKEITTTSYLTKSCANIPLHRTRKNKPNQSQSCRGAASGEAGSNPILRVHDDIRYPTYDIRNQTQFTPAKPSLWSPLCRRRPSSWPGRRWLSAVIYLIVGVRMSLVVRRNLRAGQPEVYWLPVQRS